MDHSIVSKHIGNVIAGGAWLEVFRVLNRRTHVMRLLLTNMTQDEVYLRCREADDQTNWVLIAAATALPVPGGQDLGLVNWSKRNLIVEVAGLDSGTVVVEEISNSAAYNSES